MTASAASVAPVLVFGWGNPSRGDDALGPMFVEQAMATSGSTQSARVEYLTDFQLQVEHALDLLGRERVLFIDASLRIAAPFESCRLHAQAQRNVSTHAMSPAAVMQVFERLQGHAAPPCTLLGIQAVQFELGAPLSDVATRNLAQALAWFATWLADPDGDLVNTGAPCTN